jgi:hypothetical protein
MTENESNSFSDKKKTSEHKTKELLYNLYYEIKSEILGSKIEIDEDEYQENINKISIPKLITYIHDSIQILITSKIELTKTQQRIEDEKFFSKNNKILNLEQNPISISEKKGYENIIRKLEEKERYLTKIQFQDKLQKEAMENKINEYMDMEDEFEEMKTKLKYEDGRFLNNDRKDNEIIIIRSENSKLKNTVDELENEINKLKNTISEQTKKIDSLKEEIEKLNNRNSEMHRLLLENEDINHNLNLTERYTKNRASNYLNIVSDSKEPKDNNNSVKYYKYQRMNLQSTHYNKIKKKIYSKKKSEGNKTSNNNEKKSTKENTNANMNSNDILSSTRNEYTQKLKPKLNKYFSGTNVNKAGNKSYNKKNKGNVNQYLQMNNSHLIYGKYTYLFGGNKNNINNLYSVKKIIANSSMKGLRPNSSTKIASKYRGLIYRSASGDN